MIYSPMSEESWNKLTAEEQAKLLGEAGSKVDQSLPEDQQKDQLLEDVAGALYDTQDLSKGRQKKAPQKAEEAKA